MSCSMISLFNIGTCSICSFDGPSSSTISSASSPRSNLISMPVAGTDLKTSMTSSKCNPVTSIPMTEAILIPTNSSEELRCETCATASVSADFPGDIPFIFTPKDASLRTSVSIKPSGLDKISVSSCTFSYTSSMPFSLIDILSFSTPIDVCSEVALNVAGSTTEASSASIILIESLASLTEYSARPFTSSSFLSTSLTSSL
mmetsp:Transcript_33943/g.39336  ORF Transcript_33943/g.39336 Transcript_33943/m.39336 type:complete len:202 (-) Transcript_33943:219-824(-)